MGDLHTPSASGSNPTSLRTDDKLTESFSPSLKPQHTPIIGELSRIVSGGQSGVDRAALDLALEFKIPTGGWCPKGALAEDGPIDPRYGLKESESTDNSIRTELNVRDSDGTLIIGENQFVKGTLLTIKKAVEHKKPYLIVFVDMPPDKETFRTWVENYNIKVLNVAGPRESDEPGSVYDLAKALLRELLN